MPKVYRYGLPLAFALLLIMAWSDVLFFGARTQVQGFDNKAKEPAPTLRLDYLDPFPKQAEPWFNNNFPWRGLFQRFNGNLRSLTGARSPLPDKVVFGSEEWLFKGGLQMDIYRGKRRFNPEELRRVVAELRSRRDSVEARGGRYLLSIAPLKHHIYPQFLPGHVRQLNQEYAVRQLYAALEDINVDYVDLHQPLRDYAAAHPPAPFDTAAPTTTHLYYRTDHHWTVRAGYLAAETLLRHLRAAALNVALPDSTAYTFESQLCAGLTLAQIAGVNRDDQEHAIILRRDYPIRRLDRKDVVIPPKFPYPDSYVKHYRQKNDSLAGSMPSLFVNRESFGENILLPLSAQFGNAYFLFDEWNHNLNLDHYDREGGDVYLQLVWEGFLFNLLDAPQEDGKW